MEKIISKMLCVAIVAATLCGCGKDKPSEPGETSLTTRPQITSSTQPQKTEPENTTPKATTATETTPAVSTAQQENTKLFTFEDISLEVPESFEDVTDQLGMDINGFVLGNDDIMVVATAEAMGGMWYYNYAQLIAATNNTASEITDHGGYATFTYEAGSYGMEYRYVVGSFSSGDRNWLVQAYSQKKDFEKYEATLTAIVHSVKLDPEKSPSADPGDEASGSSYSFENLSMTVPESFIDMTEQASMGIFDFVVGTQVNVVMGMKGEGMNAEDYTLAMVNTAQITRQPEDRGSYIYLQYKNTSMGVDYLYDVGIFPDGKDIWIVQAAALANSYSQNEALLQDILNSITIE